VNVDSSRTVSSIVARKAGSSTVFVSDWMSTNSDCPVSSRSKARSMIWLALPASPTAVSFSSASCTGIANERARAAITNVSHPKMAVFRCAALQRPMRAARFLEGWRGDIGPVLSSRS
jgi:hypothetical protein